MSYNWSFALGEVDLAYRQKVWLANACRERDIPVSNRSRADMIGSLLRWADRH
jgi:hypothetical protein